MKIMRLDKTKLVVATLFAVGFFTVFAGLDFFIQQCSNPATNPITQNLCSDGTTLLAYIFQGLVLVLSALCVVFMASKFADYQVEGKSLVLPIAALCISVTSAVLCFSGLFGMVLEAVVLRAV